MKNTSKKLRILAIVLVAGFIASTAWAVLSLRNFAANLNPQAGAAGAAGASNVDLSAAAGLQAILTFATPGASRAVIRFNTECSVGGPATNWLGHSIIVDPAGAGVPFIVSPSGAEKALCSGNGTATFNDGWVSAHSQAVAFVPAGLHTVRVFVQGIGAGANWRLDDTSLVVESDP